MMKSLKNMLKQDKEKYTVPRSVHDYIPITAIWEDGIFKVGNKFAKTFRFTDINYLVAGKEDKETMFLCYSELLNSLDSGATTKLTINNRRINKVNFEKEILIPKTGDELDCYREEYNNILLDKASNANGIIQEKYLTVSVVKKDIEEARTYFARIASDLRAHFSALGSKCEELDAAEKLRLLHDFYRAGEEESFHFELSDMVKKGHDFKDYICPDSMERADDYVKLGEKYVRVLFLKDYASYIKDSINENKKISFHYFQYNVRKEKKLKHNGDPYVITPLHLVWNGDYYYMIGVYDYKQRLGSFRVDRIAKCPKILDEPGTPAPEGFDVNEYINTTFRMYNSDHAEVELICDNSVMDAIIDRFGEDVTTYANDMKSFRAVANVAVSHVFFSWVFGFGGKVKIKAPAEVKEKYAEMLREAVTGLE